MNRFESHTPLPYQRSEVFDWFARPGALVRLWPPFGGSVRRQPSDGLNPGSEALLAVGLPGRPGLAGAALASTLPGGLRAELPWRARHTQLDPGHSFTDVMVSGPLAAWHHHHEFSDDPAGTLMHDIVDYELPGPLNSPLLARAVGVDAELARVFAYRAEQLRADLALHHPYLGADPLTVAVTGASGLIGSQVCALLESGGHRVIRLVRGGAHGDDEISWDPASGTLDPDALAGCDAVVHLAGYPIGGRFTAATKDKILESRRDGTALIARTLAELASDGRARTLVSASAIGYYGAHPHAAERAAGAEATPLTEQDAAGNDFLSTVAQVWESACRPAADAGVRVVNVRTGLVLTAAGGLLTQFLPLYLAGVGGPLGDRQWQSWIGIDDIASIYLFALLNPQVAGPINAVAPEPVTARQFATTLGEVLHRPSRVPVPSFGPALLLGSEGAEELAAADQRVSSSRLESLGYRFRHRHLKAQLRHVLGY
ncbi:TIGR01777 family oxidoreductase [Acidipropionibacterium thoenii]|uniref:TIGR01777 family oxidoreductase n=1 Tax=Acidipropionibacterium thoenii TaxID=1751 RepID=UPI00042249E6|nr:TIGR01777 family oxidoreductase [Acidipropionibacterium thoenii]